MKTLLWISFIIQTVLFLHPVQTEAQVFDMAKGIIGSDVYSKSISVDSKGNSYIAGYFMGTIQIDTITLSCSNWHYEYDMFVAKYDSNGNCLWAKNAEGDFSVFGTSISVDTNGNCYVTGYYKGQTKFGTIKVFGLSYCYNIFIAKYSNNGNCLWVNIAYDSGYLHADDEYSYGVTATENGYSYITGVIQDTPYFGNPFIPSYGGTDIFISKYGPDGTNVWVKRAGSVNDDAGYSISVDRNGYSYITGEVTGEAVFDEIPVTSSGMNDIFIAKYDPNGNCLWAHNAGGTGNDCGTGITLDADGNSYITGWYTGRASFGTIQLDSSAHTAFFIAKYDSSGNCLWAKSANSNFEIYGTSVSVDFNRNCFITGHFSGNAVFGTIQLSNNSTYTDIFIANYDSSGNILWVKQAGGGGHDNGYGISTDSKRKTWITGTFSGSPALFGSFSLYGSGGFITRINNSTSGIATDVDYPANISLLQNYPNPFNPSTTIKFRTGEKSLVKIKVYNSIGREIATLVNKEFLPGEHTLSWQALNNQGNPLPSGIYFIQLFSPKYNTTIKTILLR